MPMVFDDCHLSHRWTTVIVPGFSYGFPDSSQMTDTCPPLLLWWSHHAYVTVGISPIAIPSDAVSLSSKTPISRSTTLQDLLTRVTHHGRSGSDREIAYHDFIMQRFYSPKISDGKIPTPPRTLTRVLPRSTARIRSRDFENHKVSIF
jgi:hypothetical protein